MAFTTVDRVEYASDVEAQDAYAVEATPFIPAMTSNTTPSGVASASSQWDASYAPWKAFDRVITGDSSWHSSGSASPPHFLKYDFGSGNNVTANGYSIRSRNITQRHQDPKTWELQGSNNDVDWTSLDSRSDITFTQNEEKQFSNNITTGSYRYYRLYITAVFSQYCGMNEFQLLFLESSINRYSEPSIKQTGLYSLKGIAAQTDSLNKTLIRTITSPLNLSNHTRFIGYIRSSRTGSNIKIGIRDSGGTITDITPNITTANTWQLFNLDISGVANADKDAIDRVIITITNADAENTFYLDNLWAADATDFAAGIQVSKAISYGVLYPPLELNVSKANAYAVLYPPHELNVSKAVAYVVLVPYEGSSEPMIWMF